MARWHFCFQKAHEKGPPRGAALGRNFPGENGGCEAADRERRTHRAKWGLGRGDLAADVCSLQGPHSNNANASEKGCGRFGQETRWMHAAAYRCNGRARTNSTDTYQARRVCVGRHPSRENASSILSAGSYQTLKEAFDASAACSRGGSPPSLPGIQSPTPLFVRIRPLL